MTSPHPSPLSHLMSKPTTAKTKHRGKHLTKDLKQRVSRASRRAAKPKPVNPAYSLDEVAECDGGWI